MTKGKVRKSIRVRYIFFFFILFCRVSRNFDLVTRKFDIVSRNFDLVFLDLLISTFRVSRNFEILSRIFELISRNFEIPYKIKNDMYLALVLFRRKVSLTQTQW